MSRPIRLHEDADRELRGGADAQGVGRRDIDQDADASPTRPAAVEVIEWLRHEREAQGLR